MKRLLHARHTRLIVLAVALIVILPAMRASASSPAQDSRVFLPLVVSSNASPDARIVTNNVAGLSVQTTVAPSKVTLGTPMQTVITFANGSTKQLVGTISVAALAANNAVLSNANWSNQTIKANGTLSVEGAMLVDASATVGTYRVRVAFTQQSSGKVYYSDTLATTFEVMKQPKTTPVPTQTVAPTATPQPIQTPVPTAAPTSTPEPPKPQVMFGVLQGTNKNLAKHYEAGMRLRTLEIGWDHWEPTQDQWNLGYVAEQRAKYEEMKAAGFQVVLDLGMQYPPAWAKQIQPWKDQYGNTFADEINAVWSPAVRAQMEQYIAHVFANLGSDFYGVRLGSGAFVETLYPNSAPGFEYSYWAFDADAMKTSPVPGWKPGDASPNGEARRFYEWYLGALIDTVNWQQDVVRRSFGGFLIQLMPGQGLRPTQYDTLIASNLIPHGKNIYSAERGAVWDRILDGMRNRDKVIINCSSVGDSSATSPYVDESNPDPFYWSSAHWVAYNADRYGLPKMAENPGRSDYNTMRVTFAQMKQYGYSTLFWAFEPDFDNGAYASLDQYAGMMKVR